MSRVWTIEEVGDYSLLLSCNATPPPIYSTLVPNPVADFIEKYGKHDYELFIRKFGVKPKDMTYTPETLVVYFEDKTPDWAVQGMQVVI